MTDIFQEVENDLRRERLKKAWDRFGFYVIGVAVLIVVITAGYRGWIAWETSQRQAAGDRFTAALEVARAADHGAAIDQLETFRNAAPSGYGTLARFRLASELAATGEQQRAIEGFEAIAGDRGVDTHLRDLARLRAAYLHLDAGNADAAQAAVDGLAENVGGAWSYPAKEIMGLADYEKGELSRAREWFQDIEEDAAAPAELRGRARFMLTLMRANAPAAAGQQGDASGAAADVSKPDATADATPSADSEEPR